MCSSDPFAGDQRTGPVFKVLTHLADNGPLIAHQPFVLHAVIAAPAIGEDAVGQFAPCWRAVNAGTVMGGCAIKPVR